MIRTTHTGSLPRPPELVKMLRERERGEPIDPAALDVAIARASDETLARQRRIGVTIANDGEMSKMNYATYIRHRFTGIGSYPPRPRPDYGHFARFPVWAEQLWATVPKATESYEVDGPIAVKDTTALSTDIANLRAAADKAGAAENEIFMNAASPGIVAVYFPNRYYSTLEDYLGALVSALRPEYEAIVAAGFILQIDCPDLAAGVRYAGSATSAKGERHLAVEAINAATANIPPERMRMHLCWRNYQGPHDEDAPLADVFPLALKARPATISFEAANPRHEHECTYFERFGLPDGRVVIPGVIDNASTFIEHPELIAQRIGRYVAILGADRVIAGVDCGFATSAENSYDPELAYAKLKSLVAGAALAYRGEG
jgi:5-methyltetrahydropteroyltriglutamate--homocysteine methyltransferase